MNNPISTDDSNKSIKLYRIISHLQTMRESVRELKILLGSVEFDDENQREIIRKWFLMFGKQEFGVAEKLLEMEDDMLKIWAKQHSRPFHESSFN